MLMWSEGGWRVASLFLSPLLEAFVRSASWGNLCLAMAGVHTFTVGAGVFGSIYF